MTIDFSKYEYDPRKYFTTLEKVVGHKRTVDPTKLETEPLVKLGKFLVDEFERLGDPAMDTNLIRAKIEMVLQDIEKIQDKDSFEKDAEFVRGKFQLIDRIGYSLRYHEGVDSQKQYEELRDEQFHLMDEVRSVADKHSGDLKALWVQVGNETVNMLHHWCGHHDMLNQWLNKLREEFKTRQPGYVKPKEMTIEEMMEAEAQFVELQSDEDWGDVPEYTDDELAVMAWEEQYQQLDMRHQMLKVRYNRLERIALGKEEATQEEIEKMRDAQIELSDRKFPPTRRWNRTFTQSMDLLRRMRPEGHSLTISVGNDHFKRDMLLRYEIDLEQLSHVTFHVRRLSHLNNYYGVIAGHEDTEVIIGLQIDRKNKVTAEHPSINDAQLRAATALLPYSLGERWTELEREYLPGGVDFSKYTKHHFVAASRQIWKVIRKEQAQAEKKGQRD
jgi:hypothetical protein